MSMKLGMVKRAGRVEGNLVVACTLVVQPGRGLGCVRVESGPAPAPSPPPAPTMVGGCMSYAACPSISS